MRTEIDLDAAAEAGIIGEDQAIKLRNFQSDQDGISNSSSEKFQLFGGYADLVIGIGTAMVLLAVAIIGAIMAEKIYEVPAAFLGSLLTFVVPFALFQISKRINMRAAPATALVLTVAFGCFALVGIMAMVSTGFNAFHFIKHGHEEIILALIAVPHIAIVRLHWHRFRFPPTIALMVAGYSFATIAVFQQGQFGIPRDTNVAAAVALFLASGALVAAIWWDLTDIRRETERSQVAFWLHCCAGFLLSRSLFSLLTGQRIIDGDIIFTGLSISEAPYVLLMVLVAALISLLLDRRSLLVGCLLPTVTIFGGVGSGPGSLAAGLIIAGGALIVFSIAWSHMRTYLLTLLPQKLAAQLPRTNLVVHGQRPTRRHRDLWRLK